MNTPRPDVAPAHDGLDLNAALVRYLDHRTEIDRLELGDRAELALWIGTFDAAIGFAVPTQNRIAEARIISRGNRNGTLRTLNRGERATR